MLYKIEIFFFKLFADKCKTCRRPAHREINGGTFCWRHFDDAPRWWRAGLSYSNPIQYLAWQIDPVKEEEYNA